MIFKKGLAVKSIEMDVDREDKKKLSCHIELSDGRIFTGTQDLKKDPEICFDKSKLEAAIVVLLIKTIEDLNKTMEKK